MNTRRPSDTIYPRLRAMALAYPLTAKSTEISPKTSISLPGSGVRIVLTANH